MNKYKSEMKSNFYNNQVIHIELILQKFPDKNLKAMAPPAGRPVL